MIAFALVACDGGGDASCAICSQSFSNAQCMQIAVAHGCTSGEAAPDQQCSTPTMGCQFHGCPAGDIMCTSISTDSGTDTGTTDAALDSGATE